MPVNHTTSLTFSATNQSLWGTGTAVSFNLTTGTSLVFDPAETTFDIDIGGSFLGATGQAYMDFKIGMVAYASLGTAGSFDTSISLQSDVSYAGAVAAGSQMQFDLSDLRVGATSVTTTGFTGPTAGLDLVIGASAGIRNFQFTSFLYDSPVANVSIANIDKTINIIGLDHTNLSFELPIIEGIKLKGTLPTGANLEGNATGTTVVEASGASDTKFLELAADLDELLTQLLQKLPGPAAAVGKTLSETVFAEHERDIHDYVSFIPAGYVAGKFTVLDISASLGAVVTEKAKVDFGGLGNQATPDIWVKLTSDNGTAGNTADDKTVSGFIGEATSIYQLAAPLTGEGTAHITADYEIRNVSFTHSVGLGLNLSFGISALMGELNVYGLSDIEIGPLFDLTLPDGGFAFDIFSHTFAPFQVAQNAFSTLHDSFDVFYTNAIPSGWDQNASNAVQQLYAYKQALQENLNSSIATFSQIWGGAPVQSVAIVAGNQQSSPVASHPSNHTAASWFGDINATFSLVQGAGVNNFVIVDPLASIGGLFTVINAGLTLQGGGIIAPVDSADGQIVKSAILDGLADATHVTYRVRTVSQGRDFTTASAVEVQGNGGNDVLVYFKPGAFGSTFFDGGNAAPGDFINNDLFIADFLDTDANMAVNLDLFELKDTGLSAQLGNGAVLRNIESIYLRTGNAADYIGTLGTAFDDWIETSGGGDIVENRDDNRGDMIRLGTGDDVVITGFMGSAAIGRDEIFGGTGLDHAVFTNSAASTTGLRLDFISYSDDNGRFADRLGLLNGIGADASNGLLLEALKSSDGARADSSTTLDSLSVAEGERYGYKFINGTTSAGITIFWNDVEHIGVTGSDVANDLVVFTGGLIYDGGASAGDTLIVQFGLYAAGLNATNGVHLNASGAGFAFGDATIKGFERFSAAGTDYDDFMTGGAFGDVLGGLDGKDSLYGGNDSVGDLLVGGHGDDSYFWADNGADYIKDESFFDLDNLLIDVSNASGNGLVYDFQTLTDDAFYTGVAGTDRGTLGSFYRSTFSTAVLLEAMQLSSAPEGTDDYNAVTFGTFFNPGNEEFMAYQDVETVNVIGSNLTNDLLIYEAGQFYIGGENAADQDTFIADFSGQAAGIAFNLGSGTAGTVVSDAAGKILENGVLVSGMERALIKAGTGNDSLLGGGRDDWFDGGEGEDALYGGAGTNSLLGGAGRDFVLWDGLGIDTAAGGAGEDGLTVKSRNGGLTISFADLALVNISGGVVSAASSFGEMLTAVNAAPSGFEFTYGSGPESVTFREFEHVDAFGSAAFNDFILYLGAAAYSGGEQAGDDDVFAGNFGNETANITLDLTLAGTGQLGNGGLYSGFERGVVQFGLGDDFAVGGLGVDYFAGGDGDDYLFNGGGTPASVEDRLYGDAGDDTLVYTGGRAWIDGGTGNRDEAILEFAATNALAVDILDVNGGFASLSPFVASAAVDRAYLLDFVNTWLPAGPGIAYHFDTNFNADVKLFNVERMKVTGSIEADFLVGGASNSQLTGNQGNDVLVSRNGSNILNGGTGVDSYVFSGHVGDTLIAGETLNGGVVYFLDRSIADISFNVNANDLTLFVQGGLGGQVVIRNYFAPGQANGLNFTFDFTDFRGKVTTAPDGFATAGAPTGPTYIGTSGDDEVNQNSAGANIVRAGDGNDVIKADAGNDNIDGGAGNDTVSFAHLTSGVLIDLGLHIGHFAEAQGDIYVSIENAAGGQGNNTLRGSDVANILYGNNGLDTFESGQGDDLIYGLGNNDHVEAGLGDDTVFGGDGLDYIEGNEDDDDLLGGAGNDTILGGEGNDRMNGGAGNDTVTGGDGDDTFFYGGSDDAATPAHEDGLDSFDGGAGVNTADFERFGAAVRVNLGLAVNTVQTRDGPDLSAGAFRTIANLTNVQNANGSEFNDVFIGSAGANAFFGDLGNDVFSGGGGADSLDGGAGLDVYDGTQENGTTGGYLGAGGIFVDFLGAAPRVVDSNNNEDAIFNIEMYLGSAQTDYFLMGEADDDVRGGGGGDYIEGRDGNDFIEGGAGADALFGGAGAGNLVAYISSNAGVLIDLASGAASGGHADGDFIQDFAHVIGSGFGDTLSGTAANNMVVGGAGADALNGRDGNDQLLGGAGNDTMDGGIGADSMQGDTGNDTYIVDDIGDAVAEAAGAGGGTDTVRTTRASYTLTADVEKLIFTDAGNHTGKGNIGNNTLNGNAGADRFLVDAGGNDIFSGGSGSDSMDFRTSATGAVLNFQTNVHGGAALGDIFASIEKFFGSNTAVDTMRAGAGRANFSGFGGNDTLIGGNNMDIVAGGDGNDSLFGGANTDTLQGGKGNDTMNGGSAADLFVYVETAAVGGWGADIIADFQDGVDRIKIDAPGVASSIADFTISGDGTTSVLLTLDALPSSTITLNGTAPITVTAADFLFY